MSCVFRIRYVVFALLNSETYKFNTRIALLAAMIHFIESLKASLKAGLPKTYLYGLVRVCINQSIQSFRQSLKLMN